ncbi:MAG: tetratricopeptide repeat protein [bacterium]|nr:tetratricopeptide repeat protein [bacterium]
MPDASKALKIREIADAIARWGIILLAGALPFFLIPNAWVTVPQAKMFLVGIAIIIVTIAWSAARIAEGSIQIPKTYLLAVAALLPISYVVSALVTGRWWSSFVGTGVEQDTVLAILALYALLLAFAVVLSRGIRETIFAVRALLAGGAILVLLQLWKIAFPDYSGFGGALPGAVSSVIGSWHDLAIFLGLLLFFSIAFRNSLGGVASLWRRLLWWTAVGSAVLLVIINSPDVWLALAIMAALYGAYLWFELRKSGDILKISVFRALLPYIILAIVASVLSYGGTAITTRLPARLQLSQLEVRPSWQGTYAVGKQALTSAREFIVGSGPNTFTRTWSLYKPLSVNATQFWNTDFYSGVGLIPTSLLSVGILGLLSWGFLILYILWLIVRFARDRSLRTPIKTVTGVVLAGTLYLFVFNIVYVPGVSITALSFALIGILIALFAAERKVGMWTYALNWKGVKSGSLATAVVALALVIIFGSAESIRALVSDTQVNRAIVAYSATGDLDAAAKYDEYALSVFADNDRAHRTGVEIGLLQLKEMLAQGDTSDEMRTRLQNTLQATLKHGIAAVSADSGNYRNWLSLAQLYSELSAGGIQGADKNAKDAYERARIENPTSPLPLLGLAQIDLAASDNKAALEHLNSALAIKSDLTQARLLLSQLSARTNDLAKAEEEALNVVRLAPEDPLAWYNLGLVLYTRKEYDNAALALERAVQIQKDYANALFTLGLTYYQLNRPNDAIAMFEKVAELNPNDPTPQTAITNVKAGKNPLQKDS